MALTNSFYDAVRTQNVRRIRIMMSESLLVDPTFTEFDAMQKAAASVVGLYDHHDGKELIEDSSLWNNSYMDKQMVRVLSNFSQERINHLKKVVRYLRPVSQTVIHQQVKNNSQNNRTASHRSSYQEKKRRDQERGDYLGLKIGVGTVTGAVIGGIVTSVAGVTLKGVIGGVVAGAIIGGVITTFIVNDGRKL